VLTDRAGAVLAVAVRSSADERALLEGAPGVSTHELRVGDEDVGRLRLRGRTGLPPAPLLRLVSTLIASEVERLRAPERASEEAVAHFVRAVLERDLSGREDILARAGELGLDLVEGASVLVARAHSHVPTEDGWRQRVLAVADRGSRAAVPGAVATLASRPEAPGAEVVVVTAPLIAGAQTSFVRKVVSVRPPN
jgi:hypothetical protein